MTSRVMDELAHMARLLVSPTSFLGWREYLEDKARRLASWDPHEYSQLPMILAAELKRLESSHWPSKQRGRATRS